VTVDKRTSEALGYIKQGYIQYGFEELKKSAATNDLAAQFYLAVCYQYGIGTEKSDPDAFKMYRKAAERGLPDAMYHIAAFYRDGIAVAQDTAREKE
jgi:TPR repeat protein